MADQKVKVYDGSDWVDLKPDTVLPISDEAGTVKIWSAANDYINFDTGGTNDFKMDPDGNFTANGKFISKSIGTTDIAFSNDDDDGFTFISKDYPGIVSNGEQIQNYNYQVLDENPSGQAYQRYQSTVKARKGPTSYSELMFLSDDPTNLGLRFLTCGMDVDQVLGWPENCGYDSSGASALLYSGYEFLEGGRSGEYSPFIIGSTNNADVCFIQNTFPFITLDADQNDIGFHVPVESVTIKDDLRTNIIKSRDAAVDDAQIELSKNVVVKAGGAGKLTISNDDIVTANDYDPATDYSLATKKYVDDEISQAIEANQGDATLGAGTPTSETTPDDAPGSMLFDENYLWLKTNTVWKKIPLAGFSSPAATATVQVSQAQYDALNPKDPNTLYIIVG